jgi:hypothetical protein
MDNRGGSALVSNWYADLSPYEYLEDHQGPAALNVGWLDADHDFRRGAVSEPFLGALFEICKRPVNRTRGWHWCELCNAEAPIVAIRGHTTIHLGSAEIRVPGAGPILYAAPDLIYHYITEHGYHPPAEFIEAVMGAAR